MRRLTVLLALAVLVVAGGCAGLKAGRMFPSPDPAQIIVNVTDKAALVRMFGEPYQVGLDRSYSFASNFPRRHEEAQVRRRRRCPTSRSSGTRDAPRTRSGS